MKNTLNLKSVAMAAVAALSIGAMAAPAYANDPAPPPAPLPTSSSGTWTIGGESTFGGFGGSTFTGQTGYNLIEKAGNGATNVTMNAAGNLCGLSCQNGSFTFAGNAGETVSVKTGAFGQQSGVAVTAINQGGAAAQVVFDFSKVVPPAPANTPPPAPAPHG